MPATWFPPDVFFIFEFLLSNAHSSTPLLFCLVRPGHGKQRGLIPRTIQQTVERFEGVE
jgi:hypothetical protein